MFLVLFTSVAVVLGISFSSKTNELRAIMITSLTQRNLRNMQIDKTSGN